MLTLQLPNWVAPLLSHRLKVPEADWAATRDAVRQIAETAHRTESLLGDGGTLLRAADDWLTPDAADQLARTLAQGRASGVFLHPGWDSELELLNVYLWSTSSHLAYVAWLTAPAEDRYSRVQQAQTWLKVSKAGVDSPSKRKELQKQMQAIEDAEQNIGLSMTPQDIEDRQRALPTLSPEVVRRLRIQVRQELVLLAATCARIDKALSRVPRWRAPRAS